MPEEQSEAGMPDIQSQLSQMMNPQPHALQTMNSFQPQAYEM